MEPFTRGERYLNFLDGDDASSAGVREAYGANYDRLTAVKAVYDPDNFFRLNVNIAPAAEGLRRTSR